MNLSDIDLRLLRVFQAVVETKGFHSAQEELNISTSTISNHMNQLEARVGFRLCQRGRSGFRLTQKGEVFHQTMVEFFAAVKSFQAKTQQLRNSQKDAIHLGIIDNLATDDTCPLHRALSWFYSTYQPDKPTNLTIEVLSPEAIEKGLINNSLDIGIGIFDQHHSDLTYEPLYFERDVLVCRPDHRLAGVKDRRELANTIVNEKKVVRHFMQKREFAFIAQDHESVIATVCNVEESAMMILHGPFIGFLPEHYARPWLEEGRLVALMPEHFVHYSQVFMAYRKDNLEQKSAARMLADRTNKERLITDSLSIEA
ncbi:MULTISPECIES: LysR family transcriptional regulator [Oceanospirillaceae]|uniref:LysR family transcriptional regulator n=1 Tax=Oceanospirillaceae TaxID=135620 RepID=UPI0026E40122|nr:MULTISPECIES: LysR family transcriptional regulator [unclassified Oceanobacter]MDO6680670.1 LysR family transcriptional regulator [Oceanobacter sp. 5_MG-2023]MDP2506964.1 LysR family transcriptional regulator [Oceanobacter sp. 3_MG-2023]MDP2547709.1 LysR family transcriptional regulator [Oceanobacter sp. 4_MG-2023]|tara:strand:- start:8940 stop:9878 length:939 start_codon:yes stop_codon:yes gene_type:complete